MIHNIASMKTLLISIFIIICNSPIFAQIKSYNNIWLAQEFNRDVALYDAKSYLMQNVLGTGSEALHFEMIPLAAATSGELT